MSDIGHWSTVVASPTGHRMALLRLEADTVLTNNALVNVATCNRNLDLLGKVAVVKAVLDTFSASPSP